MLQGLGQPGFGCRVLRFNIRCDIGVLCAMKIWDFLHGFHKVSGFFDDVKRGGTVVYPLALGSVSQVP